MLNRRGQALVEFVLILPIFLMILFVIVDFGMIFTTKSNLENVSSDIVLFVENGEDVSSVSSLYDDIDVTVEKSNDDAYYYIILEKNVDLITPFLNRVIGDPYLVSVKRVIVYEDA